MSTLTAIPSPNARRAESMTWITAPILLALLATPIVILLSVSREYLGAMLVAYANLVVIGVAAIYFLRWRTPEGLIPPLFLLWFALGWPISSIYFAIVYPEASYITVHGLRYCLTDNLRLELSLLAFVVSYLAAFMILVRPTPAARPPDALNFAVQARVARLCLVIAMVVLGLNAVSKLVALPGPITYLADGLFL